MLSVLIPIFNFEVLDSIQTLAQQAKACNIPFEILCVDDGSEAKYKSANRAISKIEHVQYKELDENIGRTKIRNLLAQKAQYENLLFLDCDIRIEKGFIKKYLKHTQKGQVVCGGVSYEQKEAVKEERLRWHYGRKREAKSASLRNQSPYQSFTACNMLAPKKVITQHPFDEQLLQYGHEDTLLGIEFKKAPITVVHIDNPIIHLGLDDNADFLAKTVMGLENLDLLIRKGKISKDIKLYRYYRLLKVSRPLLRPLFKVIHQWTKKALTKGSSSLFLFDLFKLTYLLKRG